MNSPTKFIVDPSDQGKRLDVFLSEKMKISRSQVLKMIKGGLVSLDNKAPKKAGDMLREGSLIEAKIGRVGENGLDKKEKINGDTIEINRKIKIVAETPDYVVVEKPAGMLVHPTEAGEANTLVDFLIEKYPEIKKVGDFEKPSAVFTKVATKHSSAFRRGKGVYLRPGIVHRLDKEASGLLVIARTQKMFDNLKKQFQDREIEKEYSVLVYGHIAKDHDLINFDIDRGAEGKMVSRPKIDLLKLKNVKKIQPGKESITEFWLEKELSRFSLLRVKIHTGRTHQIRVHMFAYGHPVVGDMLYFNKKLVKKTEQKLDRIFLHAQKLCFEDLAGEKVCFESKLPKELKKYLEGLG